MSFELLHDQGYVKAEIESRHSARTARRRVRRDSSLEIIRRSMRRRTQEELHSGSTF